jgi:hypothetical protein
MCVLRSSGISIQAAVAEEFDLNTVVKRGHLTFGPTCWISQTENQFGTKLGGYHTLMNATRVRQVPARSPHEPLRSFFSCPIPTRMPAFHLGQRQRHRANSKPGCIVHVHSLCQLLCESTQLPSL